VRIGGYSVPMVKNAPGHFSLSYTVPYYPWFVRGGITIVMIARNVQGVQSTRTLTGNLQ